MSTEPVIYTMSIWTAAFWRGAGERAIKSFCQGLVAGGLFSSGTAVVVGPEAPPLDAGAVTVPASLAIIGSAVALAVMMGLFSIVTSVMNPAFTAGDTAVAARAAYRSDMPEAVAQNDNAPGVPALPVEPDAENEDDVVVPDVIEADPYEDDDPEPQARGAHAAR